MNKLEKSQLTSKIIEKAKEFGATLVGIANVEELKQSPSSTVAPQMPEYNGVGAREEKNHRQNSGEINWPENSKSVIIIAYAHPEDQPDLDYWHGRSNPPGNKKLISIINKLKEWLLETYDADLFHLPYHVEKGGIYLKDAAILGGLGCIGKNNLLLTMKYGSRIRLRGLTINIDLPSTGPTSFDPCLTCKEWCIKACPQKAFNEQLYTAEQYGRKELPGRNGNFSRFSCNIQMKFDEESAELQENEGCDPPVKITKYCRCCEFACPIGKTSTNVLL